MNFFRNRMELIAKITEEIIFSNRKQPKTCLNDQFAATYVLSIMAKIGIPGSAKPIMRTLNGLEFKSGRACLATVQCFVD